MYSPKYTAARIREASKRIGFEIKPHEIREIQEQIKRLAEIVGDDGRLIRPLRDDEKQFILNERLLSKLDFRYWSSRYAFVLFYEGGRIVRFNPNTAQNIALDVWAEMEEACVAIMIQELKARQLGMCLDPETKILTTELKWETLEDIRVGDRLVSVDEPSAKGRGNGRKMLESFVVEKRDVYEPAFLLTMDNGEKLIATERHRFLSKTRGSFSAMWKEVGALKTGNQIRSITVPWKSQDYDDAWFGGILDGEGSLRTREKEGGVEICVAQVSGEVLDKCRSYLSSRGYSFHVDADLRKGSEGSSKFGDRPVYKLVVNRINEIFRLLGQARPVRFINRRWWQGREMPGKKSGVAWSTVISIECLGPRRMIDLQTTAGTFIAEGFVSHNSTLTELAIAHSTQFYKHTNSLVASYDPDQSRKMADMMDRCWENQPWWLMPRQTAYRAGILVEFGELDSGVSIQHGSQFTGLGRGSTPNKAHLSEVSEYINPEELIDASLLNAMHPSASMFLILESTAKGRKNYWHKLWEHSKTNYSSGTASLYPMFLPWFIGRDIYPTEGWLRKHPIPSEYEPATLTYHHAERAKVYVKSNDLLRKYLGDEWEMPIEQMWWWEVTRDEYKAKDILSKFYEEMPADDLEAFQSTNRSAFDADVLSVYRENTRPPVGVFGFQGRPDQIPLRLQPDRRDIDFDSPSLTVKSRWNTSQEALAVRLVPLKFKGYPHLDPMGKLLMYEMPEDGFEYGCGIDTGDGIGLDRTTDEVLRKATLESPWSQAAEFHSSYIGATEFWPIALTISTLYSTERDGQVRQCRTAIDCLKNGESVQWEMQKRGYWNFHPWLRYDKKRVRLKDAHKMGWFSNAWSRAMMMDYIIHALKDEWIDIFSPYFVDEMGDLERDEYKQSLKATFGGHDDLFVALGQIFFSMIIMDVKAGKLIVPQRHRAEIEETFFDPVYTVGLQGRDNSERSWSTRDELMEERSELYERED